jgi:hypothetical protein|tara:strand:+ start:85 stop:471 length:387 start_codon:yes stop_codon:yes gene_type:complete
MLSLVFVTILTLVIAAFNVQYGEDYSLGLTDNKTEQLFINYQDTADSQIHGGDVEFDAQTGITLKNSYGLVTDAISIVWTFLSGGWIEQLASMWGLGASGMILARGLRILYFLSLVFALLYALFKVTV